MSWHWQFCDFAGEPLADAQDSVSATFPSQGEAETWVGQEWRELLARGVDSVILLEDGRSVYGPMSLRPPQ